MLLVDKNKLPQGLQARQSFLREYFSGLVVHTQDLNSNLGVRLDWPDDKSYYVDPTLEDGLQWWDASISPKDIYCQYRREKTYQISLADNWTVYAWSQWLQRKQLQQPVEEVIVLHIDDHTDCMAPLLKKQGMDWLDMIDGHSVQLDNPDSVKLSVHNGAISVGSFIALFFHSIEKVHFRHLRNSYRSNVSTSRKPLYPSLIYDDLLEPNQFRPALSLETFGAVGQRSIDYLVTDRLSDWLNDLPKDIPILLHLDMDYFNNRYDGDSDWVDRPKIHNPSLEQILNQITDTFKQLWTLVDRAQVEDITVSLSPGFFPAEYWSASIERLDKLLK